MNQCVKEGPCIRSCDVFLPNFNGLVTTTVQNKVRSPGRDIELFFLHFFISLPQDSKSFPQDRKLFPQVSKLLPQVSKSFPQVSKSFPQVSKSFPQVSKSLPQVSKVVPTG